MLPEITGDGRGWYSSSVLICVSKIDIYFPCQGQLLSPVPLCIGNPSQLPLSFRVNGFLSIRFPSIHVILQCKTGCSPSSNCFKSSELPELPAPTPGFWYRDKDLIHLAKSNELLSSLSYLGRPRFRILGGEPRHLTLGELPRWRGHGD